MMPPTPEKLEEMPASELARVVKLSSDEVVVVEGVPLALVVVVVPGSWLLLNWLRMLPRLVRSR